jgi:hypothetical protein
MSENYVVKLIPMSGKLVKVHPIDGLPDHFILLDGTTVYRCSEDGADVTTWVLLEPWDWSTRIQL